MNSKNAKLSYIHQIGETPLYYLTAGQILETASEKFRDRDALVSINQNKRLTFEKVFNLADHFAAGLHAIGLRRGDRFGIWASNVFEWYIIFLSCVRSGLIAVILIPGTPAPELEFCINQVELKAIACLEKDKFRNFYEILQKIAPELKTSRPGNLNSPAVPSLKSVIVISDSKQKGTYGFQEILELAEEETVAAIKNTQCLIEPDDPIMITFSSGTTGKPKAIVLTHFQVVNNALDAGRNLNLGSKSHRICLQVPFCHVFGAILGITTSLHFGATLVLPSEIYNATSNLEAMATEKCTVVYGTPTMFVDLLKLQKQYRRSLFAEIALIAGAPCPSTLIQNIRNLLNIKNSLLAYGLSECSSAIHFLLFKENSSEEPIEKYGDHLEYKIVDSNNRTVPYGTPGELCVRGYATMLGYWANTKKSNEVIGSDQWLKTGDLFVFRKNSYGEVVGRIKDVIVRGGENIYPKEIEDVINTHPDVLEAYVIGLDHERLGEEVCACVILNKSCDVNLEELRSFCMEKLAFSSIPTQLQILESFPKTLSGKIKKNELKRLIEKRN